MAKQKLVEIIDNALKEDIGRKDITTRAIVDDKINGQSEIIAKEAGVIAGVKLADMIFQRLNQAIEFKAKVSDGMKVKQGDLIAEVVGPAAAILEGERVVLNFMQRLSGIATKVNGYQQLIKEYPAEIYDTRKTTPTLRCLEKYAVRVGGGKNHRFGLDDAILIKDNHIQLAGGIKAAINLVKESVSCYKKIEVEVESLEQVKEALAAQADIIMLDNMSYDMLEQAVEIISGQAIIEASGNITKENLIEVAKRGVDVISLGCLTHSVKALDISLNFK